MKVQRATGCESSTSIITRSTLKMKLIPRNFVRDLFGMQWKAKVETHLQITNDFKIKRAIIGLGLWKSHLAVYSQSRLPNYQVINLDPFLFRFDRHVKFSSRKYRFGSFSSEKRINFCLLLVLFIFSRIPFWASESNETPFHFHFELGSQYLQSSSCIGWMGWGSKIQTFS